MRTSLSRERAQSSHCCSSFGDSFCGMGFRSSFVAVGAVHVWHHANAPAFRSLRRRSSDGWMTVYHHGGHRLRRTWSLDISCCRHCCKTLPAQDGLRRGFRATTALLHRHLGPPSLNLFCAIGTSVSLSRYKVYELVFHFQRLWRSLVHGYHPIRIKRARPSVASEA